MVGCSLWLRNRLANFDSTPVALLNARLAELGPQWVTFRHRRGGVRATLQLHPIRADGVLFVKLKGRAPRARWLGWLGCSSSPCSCLVSPYGSEIVGLLGVVLVLVVVVPLIGGKVEHDGGCS